MSALTTALDQLTAGGMIVLTDDAARENEGDLVMAATHITPAAITFMAKQASGLICLCLTPDHAAQLALRPMVEDNQARRGTAFTISIEARDGITTGISAADRAHSIRTASAPAAQPRDIVSPGHVFPLVAKAGGVLERDGHTEGAIDLMRMAGLQPAAVICEIMGDDGRMLSGTDLQAFARHHRLPMLDIATIIAARAHRAA